MKQLLVGGCLLLASSASLAEEASLTLEQYHEVSETMTSRDVEGFIPTDIPSGSSAGLVTAKILDRTVNTLLQKVTKGNKRLAGMTRSVTKGLDLKTDLNFGSQGPNEINHKVSFQAKILESIAAVKYSGALDASLVYNMKDNESSFRIKPELDLPAILTISQAFSPKESVSSLKIEMNY